MVKELQESWLQAWHFAARAHRAQKLPGTDLPYLVHVGAVAMEVLVAHQQDPLEHPSIAVQCALLHDVLEDTSTQESELVACFGDAVAAGVRALTKDASLSKREAMLDSLYRIKTQPVDVWAVKLADRITNLASPPSHWSLEKIASYREEAQLILDALQDAHPLLARRLANRIAEYPPR